MYTNNGTKGQYFVRLKLLTGIAKLAKRQLRFLKSNLHNTYIHFIIITKTLIALRTIKRSSHR